jgi:hypothetical protein
MEGAEFGTRPVVLLRLPPDPDAEAEEGEGAGPKVHKMPSGPFVHLVNLSDEPESWAVTPPAGFVLRDGCIVWSKERMTWEDHGKTVDPDVPESCR